VTPSTTQPPLQNCPFIIPRHAFIRQQLFPNSSKKEKSKIKTMKNKRFVNIAIFVLFFGIALIEAIQKQNWLLSALFVSLGIMSLIADRRDKN
jgi:hypothetical protein